ncbi:MAG: TIGR00296 family protein [Thermoplasmata archaeon]|nr:TIGR00296 family protein [Thermoplasmata archaeon]
MTGARDEEAVGPAAVRLARRALEGAFAPEPLDPARVGAEATLPTSFGELRGVFVTLRRYPGGRLRGCIGFTEPRHPLRTALPIAAVLAATEDPRFPALTAAELGTTTIEVSILTRPEPISVRPRSALPSEIHVGRDGLIVERAGSSGLLLPQVATEQRWDAATFLAETCRKAGLPPDAWEQTATKVSRFEAIVFGETRPRGPIESGGASPTDDSDR